MEESTANDQWLAEQAVGVIHKVLGGMSQKGEQVQGKKYGC